MIGQIVVRKHHPGDFEDVAEILSDYPSPTGRVWTKSAVDEMMSDSLKEQPDGVLVAQFDGKVVGFAIVFYRERFTVAYVDYIQVKMEWIGKGVGHKLLEECLSWARKRDARIIYTETGRDNERAIRFYQRHGFKITGHIPEYYREGLDAVILTKKLH